LQALVQRVSSAEISIDDLMHAKINCGLLAFICFELGDTVAAIDKFISKISSFCFFDDDSSILASNLKQIEGELMIVSQFTLAAVTKKGNKASFHKAAKTNDARALYNELIAKLDDSSINYQSGRFGADMNVSLVNTGPVTFSFNF
jgi:D-tyrosyl-tRNA(Tyr) deacylase